MSDRLETHHKGARHKDIDSAEIELTRLRAENEKLRARSVLIPESVQKIIDDYPAVCAERDRMREALNKIAERHIPDQPASDGKDEADYVRTHYAQLRWIAKRAALEGVTEPATHKGPEEHLNLRNAECLPSTVAVMKPEPAR